MMLFYFRQLLNWSLQEGLMEPILVVSGDARGRKNGIPTLNAEDPLWTKAHGVYLVQVAMPGVKASWAMLHYGPRLSYGIESVNVEVHLLEWSEAWRKALLTENPKFSTDFFLFIRENRKFESTDALVANIRSDMIEAASFILFFYFLNCEKFSTQSFA